MELKVETNKNGKIEIYVTASAEDIMHGKEHALNVFSPHVEVTGFRKGKAPHNLVEKNVKEEKLVEETIGHVAKDAYREALSANEILPITEPHVTINELKDTEGGIAADVFWPKIQREGTVLTITTFQRPQVTLGDWEKAAKKAQKPEDVKKEIEEKSPGIETATSIQDAKNKSEIPASPAGRRNSKSENEEVAPIVDLKQVEERAQREYDERIIDELVNEATVEIAEDLIMGESQHMVMQQVQIVEQLGIDYKDFLKNQGKTIEEVEKQSRDSAKRSIKGRFVLGELSKQFEKELGDSPTYQQVIGLVKDKIAGK